MEKTSQTNNEPTKTLTIHSKINLTQSSLHKINEFDLTLCVHQKQNLLFFSFFALRKCHPSDLDRWMWKYCYGIKNYWNFNIVNKPNCSSNVLSNFLSSAMNHFRLRSFDSFNYFDFCKYVIYHITIGTLCSLNLLLVLCFDFLHRKLWNRSIEK